MAPMYACDAPAAGTGKSKLADVCAVFATGHECPVSSKGTTRRDGKATRCLPAALEASVRSFPIRGDADRYRPVRSPDEPLAGYAPPRPAGSGRGNPLARNVLHPRMCRSVIALFLGTVAALAAGGVVDAAAAQPTEQVLQRFSGVNGATPQGALVIGAAGALYGTAETGGNFFSGMVFKLVPPAAGQTLWTETHLYDFCATKGCVGGTLPLAGLTPDGTGGFFGTTSVGGAHGNGTVFHLQRPAVGMTRWSLTPIYKFCADHNCEDGGNPAASLLRSRPGSVLYGTTFAGGTHAFGTVFSLTPPATGGTEWNYAVIHDFDFADGAGPLGGLIFGSAGELYGTTSEAGAHGHGTAFVLTPPTADSTDWSFRVIYQFCAEPDCVDGSGPNSGLWRGKAGTLYGTTLSGGSGGWGTVYALLPPDYGTERVLHSFAFSDGAAPVGGLIQDPSGALYGTTSMDGRYGYGTVFKLASTAGKGWVETVLRYFVGVDGNEPLATLVLGKGGALYGTTEFGGGANNDGVVFKVTP
jgi:uncharacterized repeat protein (TIGR03803 family)